MHLLHAWECHLGRHRQHAETIILNNCFHMKLQMLLSLLYFWTNSICMFVRSECQPSWSLQIIWKSTEDQSSPLHRLQIGREMSHYEKKNHGAMSSVRSKWTVRWPGQPFFLPTLFVETFIYPDSQPWCSYELFLYFFQICEGNAPNKPWILPFLSWMYHLRIPVECL